MFIFHIWTTKNRFHSKISNKSTTYVIFVPTSHIKLRTSPQNSCITFWWIYFCEFYIEKGNSCHVQTWKLYRSKVSHSTPALNCALPWALFEVSHGWVSHGLRCPTGRGAPRFKVPHDLRCYTI